MRKGSRSGAPPMGSTLMTSAPIFDKSHVDIGAATNFPKSKTRMSFNTSNTVGSVVHPVIADTSCLLAYLRSHRIRNGRVQPGMNARVQYVTLTFCPARRARTGTLYSGARSQPSASRRLLQVEGRILKLLRVDRNARLDESLREFDVAGLVDAGGAH